LWIIFGLFLDCLWLIGGLFLLHQAALRIGTTAAWLAK
jgi:hypothetical protein